MVKPIIRARDLGDPGPKRPWGSALKQRAQPIPVITERPIRPMFGGLTGKCPHCGSRYFGCCEKDLEENDG